MTIAQRLYVLIIAVVTGLASLAGLGTYQMAKVCEGANYANVNTVPSLRDLNHALSSVSALRILTWEYVAQADPAQRGQREQAMEAASERAKGALARYERENISNDQDRALLAADKKALAEYDALRKRIVILATVDEWKANLHKPLPHNPSGASPENRSGHYTSSTILPQRPLLIRSGTSQRSFVGQSIQKPPGD